MTHTESAPEVAIDPSLWAAEQAFRACHRIEQVRGQVRAAQLSVAASFERSAHSHERVAKIYEHRKPQGNYREHAAVHREFAREDRQIAQQLRQMATTDP
jgi:hypothetical protein